MAASTINPNMNGLSTNFFVSTANTKVVPKDAYTGVNGQSTLTGIANLLASVDLSVNDVLRGGAYLSAQVPSLSAIEGAAASAIFSVAALTQRILSSSPATLSVLGKLSASMAAGLTGAIQDGGQLFASIAGVVQQVSAAVLPDIYAVGSLLNQVTGTAAFLVNDVEAQLGLSVGLVIDCNRLGIPNAFGAISVTLGGNQSLINQVAQRSLPSVIQASDVGSLSSMGTAVGPGGMYAFSPSLITDFSSEYATPPSASTADAQAEFGGLMGAYDAVDPSWDVGQRDTTAGPVQTLDISSITGGSDDFNSLVTQGAQGSGSADQQLYALAPALQPTTVQASLQATYPNTVYTPNTVPAQATVDPGLLASNPTLAAASQTTTNSLPFWDSSWGPYNGDPSYQPAPDAPAGASPTSHTLLGYYADGRPGYSDDQFESKEPFFPLGTTMNTPASN